MRTILLGFCALAAGCTCKSSAPAPDQPPKSFPASGVVIDQPKDGETISGQWVAVTGWLDPARFRSVVVAGAPVQGFYPPTSGHMGVPNATLAITDGGHFYAPRVPLQEGATELVVAPLPLDGSKPTGITLHVTGKDITTVPMTAAATPAGGNAPLQVEWRAAAASGSPSYQWDFDGDGVFDAEGNPAKTRYAQPGQYWAMARAKIDSRWVYAVGRIAVAQDPQVTHEASIGDHARLLTVVDREEKRGDDEFSANTGVMVVTDRGIELFDAKLNPIRTLTPPGPVRGLAGDGSGRVWVALDHQVIRYRADGTLDTAYGGGDGGFAPDGGFGAIGAICIEHPPRVLDGGEEPNGLLVLDGAGLLTCEVPRECRRAADDVADSIAALRCADSQGSTGYGIVTRPSGAVWQLGMESTPLLGTSGLTDVGLCSYWDSPYYFGVGAGGKLVEWCLLPIPARTSTLPFVATTVACDPVATRMHTRQQPEPYGMSQVPVLYVAGSGHLQRRVLPPVKP